MVNPTTQPARCLFTFRRLLVLIPTVIGVGLVLVRFVSLPPVTSHSRDAGIAQTPGIIVNSVGMKLVPISAGRFLMGSVDEEAEIDERPAHSVEIAKPFYLGQLEVTREEYERVTGENPSQSGVRGARGIDRPVETVSWDDAVAFCRRLSELPEEKKSGRTYRLPTEAEWEYACRAGTATRFANGPSLSKSDANLAGVATRKGGSYPANAWGLYDMHGNVLEWCADWYDDKYYQDSPSADPQGSASGTHRVARGGGWWSTEQTYWHSSASRHYHFPPEFTDDKLGFRVLCQIR